MEQALRASLATRSSQTDAASQRHYGNLVDSIPLHDSTAKGEAASSTSSSTARAQRTPSTSMHPQSAPITVPFASTSNLDRPVGLSFPAMLKQNVPGFKARSRQHQIQPPRGRSEDKDARSHGEKASQKLGRRKQRRWENANFHGSKYITPPRSSDFHPVPLSSNPTFPSPPPSTFFPYKPSGDSTDPNARLAPTFDDMVVSADHGRFSLPIKGLKRNTRRIVAEGGIGSQIVEAVDAELRAWLEGTSVWMMQQGGDGSIVEGNSVAAPSLSLNSGKRCICEVETDHGRVQAINQFAKQPHSLVWQSEDSFTRFLVHAIARYYRIVSFTKSDPSTSTHLIWLLRPNMAPRAGSNSAVAAKPKSGFETPPTTASEWEASSANGLTTSASEIDSNVDTAGSSAEMLSSEEAESEDAGDAEYRLDEEGDETIIALEEEDAVILSRSASPATLAMQMHSQDSSTRLSSRGNAGRQRRGPASRPVLGGRALSDIDSGAEVDDEKDERDGFDDLDDLQDSITDLSLVDLSRSTPSAAPGATRTSRWHPNTSSANATATRQNGAGYRGAECSLSRETSPVSYYRKAVAQQVRSSKTNQHGSASKGWRMPDRTFSEWALAG